MSPSPVELPSRGEIDRCGQYLVDWRRSRAGDLPEFTVELDRLMHARDVLNDFRRAHQYPMTKVRLSLESFVRTAGVSGSVTQRLKRNPRIVRKLHRMGASKLARLEDIGGCRVVVPSAGEAVVLERHATRVWGDQIKRTRDYVETPKDIGYRATHLVVVRDNRRIEVQIRTRGQQQWADHVENTDSRLNLTLKDGTGPPELLEYLASASNMIHAAEYDTAALADDPRTVRFEQARETVVRLGYYSE